MTEVFVVIRYDRMRKGIVWKVYNSEKKAENCCNLLNADDYSKVNGHRFEYEKWVVR